MGQQTARRHTALKLTLEPGRLRVTLDSSTELEDQGEMGCSDTVCYNADGSYLGKVVATVICRSQRFSAANKAPGKSEYDIDLDYEYGAFS